MKHSQYYAKRVHGGYPRNKFQSAICTEAMQWEGYLVASAPDYRDFIKARVELLHQKYPRCGVVHVHGAIEIHGEVFRIDIGDFLHFHMHPVKGRWCKCGGFQLYMAQEGGVPL